MFFFTLHKYEFYAILHYNIFSTFFFFVIQLDLYKEEFTYEKHDHDKAKRENTQLKNDIKQAKLLIEKLNKDSQSIRTSYKKLYAEKEQIILQLRKLTHPTSTISNTTPVQKYTCNNPPSSSSFSHHHTTKQPLFESYTLKLQGSNNEQWIDRGHLQVNVIGSFSEVDLEEKQNFQSNFFHIRSKAIKCFPVKVLQYPSRSVSVFKMLEIPNDNFSNFYYKQGNDLIVSLKNLILQ